MEDLRAASSKLIPLSNRNSGSCSCGSLVPRPRHIAGFESRLVPIGGSNVLLQRPRLSSSQAGDTQQISAQWKEDGSSCFWSLSLPHQALASDPRNEYRRGQNGERCLPAAPRQPARSIRCHRRALVWSRSAMKKGCPVGEPSTPRALARAPGGESGAVPTAMAIRAGAEWPLQTDVGTSNFACLPISSMGSSLSICDRTFGMDQSSGSREPRYTQNPPLNTDSVIWTGKENELRQTDKQPVTPARARCNGGRLQNPAFELGTSEQLHSFGGEEGIVRLLDCFPLCRIAR
jgi:hypothetical protein